jgi:hypothetical protein
VNGVLPHDGHTGSHLITEVKQRWEQLELGVTLELRVRRMLLESVPASCGLGPRRKWNTAYQRLQYYTTASLFKRINALKIRLKGTVA